LFGVSLCFRRAAGAGSPRPHHQWSVHGSRLPRGTCSSEQPASSSSGLSVWPPDCELVWVSGPVRFIVATGVQGCGASHRQGNAFTDHRSGRATKSRRSAIVKKLLAEGLDRQTGEPRVTDGRSNPLSESEVRRIAVLHVPGERTPSLRFADGGCVMDEQDRRARIIALGGTGMVLDQGWERRSIPRASGWRYEEDAEKSAAQAASAGDAKLAQTLLPISAR